MRQSREWYHRPLRIAALQCNFGENSLKIIDIWKKAGFNTEQLFHPIADLYSAHYDPCRHRKALLSYARKARRKGLRLILYLNVHILGPSLTKHGAAWSQRDQKGRIIRLYEGTYPSICVNSPWRRHFFSVLDSLKDVPVDGLFLDGPFVAEKGCFCRHCAGKRGSSLWEFSRRTRDGFLNEAYQYWKRLKPGAPFYMNLPIFHASRSFVDIPSALRYNDIVGSEGGFMHYGPARHAFLWKPSFTAKLLEAIAPDKPRVVFMAADHKPWSWWPHTPAETNLCIASCTAHGADVWYGLHGSSALMDTPSGNSAANLMCFLAENEDALDRTRSLADVGLVYSYATDRYLSAAGDESDFLSRTSGSPAESAVRGYFSLLTESQIPFDMVTDLSPDPAAWAKYKVLVLPALGALDDAMVRALKAFTASGGTLIAEFDASLYDGKGKRRKDFGLSGVFGASADGKVLNHDNWNYFRLKTSLLPLPLSSLPVRLHPGARVLAERLSDMPGRYARLGKPASSFLVENRFGRGRCYYFAGTFGRMHHEYHPPEYRTLIVSLVRKTGAAGPGFDNAPSHLEASLRKSANGMFLHLINYTGGPSRPIERLTPVINLKMRFARALRVKSVVSRRLGQKLSRAGGVFVLPRLHDYDILEMI
jgi:hypothetical protein